MGVKQFIHRNWLHKACPIYWEFAASADLLGHHGLFIVETVELLLIWAAYRGGLKGMASMALGYLR